LAEMRALIFELRPESLETEGLVAALVKHAEALKARHQIDVSLDLCDEPPVALEVKEILYRVAQEALHNTIKHAQATQIEVRLTCEDQKLVLEVGDNGIGFDPAQEFPGHLGLLSMRERVEGTGGSFRIVSAFHQGTKIRAQIPIADS